VTVSVILAWTTGITLAATRLESTKEFFMDELNLSERTWALMDLMMGASSKHMFTTVWIATRDRTILTPETSRWANGEPSEPSRAPLFGPLKAAEVLFAMAPTNAVVMSPIPWLKMSGYKGGIGEWQRLERLYYVVSASAMSERADLLFASLLLYSMKQEVRFHHYGRTYDTQQAMMEAVHRDEKIHNVRAIELPARDHFRFYIPVQGQGPNGIYWLEHQWFPDPEHQSNKEHFDVVTSDPHLLLQTLGGSLEQEPEIWDDVESSVDPVGVLYQDNRGIPIGIMARARWKDIRA